MLIALLLTVLPRLGTLRAIFEIYMLFALLLTFALSLLVGFAGYFWNSYVVFLAVTFAFFVGRAGYKLFWFVIRPGSNVCPFFVRAKWAVSNLLALFAMLSSSHLNFLMSQVARLVFLAIVLSKVVIFCRPCVIVRELVVLLLQTCLSVVFIFLGLQS